MNSSDTKSHKARLRQINRHLWKAHEELGIQRDSVGFVEVVRHPNFILPSLNYVTPRRGTALVPGKHVEEGIQLLRQHRRQVRVLYVDDLFPPFFGESLERMGLTLHEKYPLWVFDPAIVDDLLDIPSSLNRNVIVNGDGLDIWSIVWRNANYKIYSTPLEPLMLGKHNLRHEHLVDVILYHHNTPVAVARLTFYENTAHLMARAIIQSTQPFRLHQWLIQSALEIVRDKGSNFMFVCDASFEQVLMLATDLSCHLEGNMLSYSDSADDNPGEKVDDTVEQPILHT